MSSETTGAAPEKAAAAADGTAARGEVKPAAEATTQEPAAEVYTLPRFSVLDPVTARIITAAAPTRLIVIAGMNGSGKTTLVATVYDRFLRSVEFAGYAFAGSETLIGFEQRCHLASVASGLSRPETERTRVSEQMALLHLRVRRADGSGHRRDLLFTDIFGEAFREAKDSTVVCRRLTFLPRADRVVMLVDGAQLVHEAARLPALACVDDFLRRSIDSGMLGKSARVDIATTKWDEILRLSGDERARIEAYLTDMESRFRDDFGGLLGALRTARVAARPAPPSLLAVGYGVDGLFPAWVEEGRVELVPSEDVRPDRLGSELDRYSRRSTTDTP